MYNNVFYDNDITVLWCVVERADKLSTNITYFTLLILAARFHHMSFLHDLMSLILP